LIRRVRYSNENIQKITFKHHLDSGRYCILARHAKDEIIAERLDNPLLDCFVQVQPDLEQLDVNMEDNEGVEEAKEEMKLGKLQFSLDYDFQKGEVGYM